MESFLKAASVLPPEIRAAALKLTPEQRAKAEEIRLRKGFPPTVLLPDGERALCCEPVTSANLDAAIEIATSASAHSARGSLKNGFVTSGSGCRVGVCGTAVMGKNGVEGVRNISSVAIRIPRQVTGCADGLWPSLSKGGFASALILSPPGGGKTTLLRELVRKLSEGGKRVALADERGELAAGFDIGPGTDVMSLMPKADAVMLLLRAMNPEIIALDEITAPEDIRAIISASNCGVSLLATAHALDISDLSKRPMYRELLGAGIFKRVILIKKEKTVRTFTVEELYA